MHLVDDLARIRDQLLDVHIVQVHLFDLGFGSLLRLAGGAAKVAVRRTGRLDHVHLGASFGCVGGQNDADAERPDGTVQRIGVNVAGEAVVQVLERNGAIELLPIIDGFLAGSFDDVAAVGEQTGDGLSRGAKV